MIPIQLTIQGLYSYQEKQTIDFTQLTAANLFGVFGSVGSGKSSILEAITFAVYGRTDRLNLSGDNRYYNMMNLKSNELLIDFIFETGREQTPFRATVKGKRNGKKFEDVKTLERSAYQKVANEWIPIDSSALEQCIGLSYDNFKRTIIIPQGQFQEFLQLGNRDRTQMMKELFNLNKFEFYYKVKALEGKNNAQIQNLAGQLQQLGDVDPEQIKTYQNQLEILDRELKKLSEQLAAQQKTEEEFRKLQQLMAKKTEAEKTVQGLTKQQPEFKALEKLINRYEYAVIHFKHLLDSLKTTTEKQAIREKQIRLNEATLKTAEEEINKLTQQLDEIKPAYEKREELKQRAEELSRLLHMKELEQKLVKEDERLQKGTLICEQTVRQLEKIKAKKQQLEELIKTTKKQVPDLTLLSNIKTWHVEQHNLKKQLQGTDEDLKKLNTEIATTQKDVAKLLNGPLFDQLPANANYDTCIKYLQQKNEQAKELQKTISEQEHHIKVKAQLKAYSEGLEEGQPCPLCGSAHHPELFKTDDIQEALLKFENEKNASEKLLEQISVAGNRLNLLENQQQLLHRQLKELEEKKKIQQQNIEAHAHKFVWDNYKEEEALNKAFKEAERLQTNLKEQEAQLDDLAKQLNQEEKNKERYQAEVEKIKTLLTELKTELKTIGGQLQIIDPNQYNKIPIQLIEEEKANVLKEYTRIAKEFTEKSIALTEQTKLRDTLSGNLTANLKELEQERQASKNLQQKLDEQLAKSNFETISEVNELLTKTMEVEAEKQKLALFKESLLRGKSQLEELQNEIGTRSYDRETHQKLLTEISTQKELTTQKNQEKGKIAELLKKLEKDLESQAALRKELEQLELRAENIKTMKSLFKASGFVNYISSVYLQNLCNAANDRFFQLTRQKLSLEITPDNNFQVRDFLNGGKVRSVKTLSGGQTFQAALSLALALADNIQKITESNQNFFFLDEGFGSLDKDSLAVVFDTLRSLRQENRIVGVISHVEEMQQEIEIHLRIENDEEKGSRIYPSWAG